MGLSLLYDHLDHLLDDVDHAPRTRGYVQAYAKLHEQRTEQAGRVTLAMTITGTWMMCTERIIHAARMHIEEIPVAQHDTHHERHVDHLREQGCSVLALLHTTQFLWEVRVNEDGPDAERQIVLRA